MSARERLRHALRDRALLALLVAAAALLTALTDPIVDRERDVHRQLLVFDITQSMNVIDDPRGASPPTRLQRAQRAAIAALARMTCGSEIGVGLFTGHRTLVLFAPVEVCAHFGDIAATIGAIDWRMAWEARSEVAKGLHSALLATRSLGGDASVVFLTDGHEAPPVSRTLPPRYRGAVGEVRGAVGGVGGDVLRPIPKLDPEGRQRGFWRPQDVLQVDPGSLGRPGSSAGDDTADAIDQVALRRRIAAGNEHLSSLKEDYLRGLARGLELHYRRVRDADDLRRLLEHPDLAMDRPSVLALRGPLGALALVLVAAVYAGAWWPRGTRKRAQRSGMPRASTSGTP